MTHDPRHRGYDGERGGTAPLAASADILRCYEEAVQEPMVECVNLDALYTNAQAPGSDRVDARVLREDFCSTGTPRYSPAIIARTWLTLHPENTSQGVDIDLAALQDSQRRWGAGRVRLVQSPAYSHATCTTEMPTASAPTTDAPARDTPVSTWTPGQASARLDRRLAKKHAKHTPHTAPEPRMTLLHSDVLDMPVPPLASGESLAAPDLVASLNYAMAYFHDRATLLAYLRSVVASLRPKTGVFITDMFGGPSTGEEYDEQPALWDTFWDEPGFRRSDADAEQTVLDADLPHARRTRGAHDDLQVLPPPTDAQRGTRAEWPRGRLKRVRTGQEHGGFEYWREDGPVDYATNRFRMSLSFRFSDRSWLRDVFAYDFRIWSLRELTEAMEEAGFAHVHLLVLPRNDVDTYEEGSTSDTEPDDMMALLLRTEQEEKQRRLFHTVQPGEKVFCSRSFATYIVARVP